MTSFAPVASSDDTTEIIPAQVVVVHRQPTHLSGRAITRFTVEGITCASCVKPIREALLALTGVTDVSVSIIDGEVVVKHDAGLIAKEALMAAIDDVGFEPRFLDQSIDRSVQKPVDPTDAKSIKAAKDAAEDTIATNRFAVSGISCASCVEPIRNGLMALTGVLDVSVSVIDGEVTVQHDTAQVGPRDLIAAFGDLGFDATLIQQAHAEAARRRQQQDKHLRDARNRFLVSLALAIPTFILAMVIDMMLPEHNPARMAIMRPITGSEGSWPILTVVLLILATISQFTVGLVFYTHSYRALRHTRRPNMDVLVALGTTSAYLGSIASAAVDGGHTQFFEISVLLLMFILLGRYLEIRIKHSTAELMTKLLEVQPERATLVSTKNKTESESESDAADEEELSEIDVALVQAGDILQVPAGARVPVDGDIVQGESDVDESMLTGEPLPLAKTAGDSVIGCTLNLTRPIRIRVTRIGQQTTFSRIVRLVRDAQASRPQIQAVADRIAAVFVPAVIVLSVILFFVWLGYGLGHGIPTKWLDVEGEHTALFALFRAVSVLVIACPCAIGLAAPAAMMVGSGVAARHGLLVKGGAETMERARAVNVVVLDKTGTISEGRPRVTELFVLGSEGRLAQKESAAIRALAEQSTHPLSRAVAEFLAAQYPDSSSLPQLDNVQEMPGRGMSGTADNVQIVTGSEKWITESGCTYATPDEQTRALAAVQRMSTAGSSLVFVGIADRIAAIAALSDTIRPEAAEAVRQLKALGIDVWMLTGDNRATALAVAAQVGIDNVVAQVLPEEKAEKIQWLQEQGHAPSHRASTADDNNNDKATTKRKRAIVAMVGDGINDSIALSQADVGIAIGTGSAVAIDVASALLLRDDLRGLATLFDLSATVLRRVKLNFAWAFGYNLLAIPIAAGILYPIAGVGLPAVVAGIAMAASSVTVMLSSVLLKLYRPPGKY